MAAFTRRAPVILSLAALMSVGVRATGQSASQPLTRLQFDIIGVRLVVDPPALTVPKNIATQINTSLVDAARPRPRDASDALATLTEGRRRWKRSCAVRRSRRRGSRVAPGQPLPIPPLALAGDYFLDGIRLVKDGQTVLDATSADGHAGDDDSDSRVINEVFVASVTSQAALARRDPQQGHRHRREELQRGQLPGGVQHRRRRPSRSARRRCSRRHSCCRRTPDRTELIQQISALNRSLAATQTTLPPQFDRPGLNFSIAALPFFPVDSGDNNDPRFRHAAGDRSNRHTGQRRVPAPVLLGAAARRQRRARRHAPRAAERDGDDRAANGSRPGGRDVTTSPATIRCGSRASTASASSRPCQSPSAVPTASSARPTTFPCSRRRSRARASSWSRGCRKGRTLFDIAIRTRRSSVCRRARSQLEGQASGAVFVRNPTFAVTLAHPQDRAQRRAVRRLRDGDQHVAHRGESGEREPGSAVDHRGAAAVGSDR